MIGRGMRSRRLHGTLVALVAAGLAGCGNTKVERSTTPAQPTGGPAAATGTLSPTASGTFTGVDTPNRFGDVQVDVVVARGRITDVKAVQLPMDRARSRFISAQAGPILRSEVLAAQSGQIDLVSGATYTSDSFAGSVQSALSQVH
jgi:uncharacterized protein with FMN-binding domain